MTLLLFASDEDEVDSNEIFIDAELQMMRVTEVYDCLKKCNSSLMHNKFITYV